MLSPLPLLSSPRRPALSPPLSPSFVLLCPPPPLSPLSPFSRSRSEARALEKMSSESEDILDGGGELYQAAQMMIAQRTGLSHRRPRRGALVKLSRLAMMR